MTIESPLYRRDESATDELEPPSVTRGSRTRIQRQRLQADPELLDAHDDHHGLSEAVELSSSTIPARRLRTSLILADATAVLVGAAISFVIWQLSRAPGSEAIARHIAIFLASYPIWLGAIVARRLLVARAVVQPAEELHRIWTATALATVLTVLLAFVLHFDDLSRGWVSALFLSAGAALSLERWAARKVFYRLRKSGQITRRIAVIGTDTNAIRIMHSLQHDRAHGYSVAGYISDDDIGERGGFRRLGPLDRTAEILAESNCSGAIISLPSIDPAVVNTLARRLTDRGVHLALSTSLNDIDIARLRPQQVDRRTMLYVEPTIRDGWRARAKRLFDIVLSVVALVVASPILLVAGAAIWIESRGSILFRQVRVGRNGDDFTMLKLRTMHHDAEERLQELLASQHGDARLFKMTDDPRITRVGRVLRKWSVDEIPQFINVLKGEMSIVGPRPALPREVEQWDDETRERLRVMPGITGLWQVEGRSDADFDAYKRLDLFYVDNWSLAHDLIIVLKTFSAVTSGRGAC